jgi:hypothetical protein
MRLKLQYALYRACRYLYVSFCNIPADCALEGGKRSFPTRRESGFVQKCREIREFDFWGLCSGGQERIFR